jgi:hypothetical protein
MDSWYDLRSWSEQRREDALQEARTLDAAKRARASRGPRSGRASLRSGWGTVLTLLR